MSRKASENISKASKIILGASKSIPTVLEKIPAGGYCVMSFLVGVVNCCILLIQSNALLGQDCVFPYATAISAQAAMTFIAAKDDYLTGEISVLLLLSPVVFFLPVVHNLNVLAGLIMFAVLFVFKLLKKMGGADVIIFTEIALLFGIYTVYIMLIAYMLGIIQYCVTRNAKVRIIPAIFTALEIFIIFQNIFNLYL